MRATSRTLLVVAATLGLLALFLRNANLAEVAGEIRDAAPGDLLLGSPRPASPTSFGPIGGRPCSSPLAGAARAGVPHDRDRLCRQHLAARPRRRGDPAYLSRDARG